MFKLTPAEAGGVGYIFVWCIGINAVIIVCGVIDHIMELRDKKRLAHAANMDEPVRK